MLFLVHFLYLYSLIIPNKSKKLSFRLGFCYWNNRKHIITLYNIFFKISKYWFMDSSRRHWINNDFSIVKTSINFRKIISRLYWRRRGRESEMMFLLIFNIFSDFFIANYTCEDWNVNLNNFINVPDIYIILML